MRKNSALAFFIAVLLLSPIITFACGGAGACSGTQEGVHGHAKLFVVDRTSNTLITIPKLGIEPMFADGKLSFCYKSVHTHDHTHNASDTIHIQVSPDNNNSLLRFLSQFLPISSVKAIYVDTLTPRGVLNVTVQPETTYLVLVDLPAMPAK